MNQTDWEKHPHVIGPRSEGDPLGKMDLVKRIESIQAKDILGATPWRMTSSTKKILDAKRFERFWRGLGASVSRNLGMASLSSEVEVYGDGIFHGEQVSDRMCHGCVFVASRVERHLMAITSKHYLGVEIGGTKLQAGVCGVRGRLQRLVRVAVERKRGRAGILQQFEQIIPDLLSPHKVTAIGVGFGGPVDSCTGRVVRSFQVSDWDGFALRRWFERKFALPVEVENDSNCAALAEATLGAGSGKRRVFYTNVGTGIGGGLVLDGKLYHGRYGAMEIGHTRVGDGCQIIESWASGLAIERGVSTLPQAAEHFGVALANVITLLNPDLVVVGGGVSLAGESFFRPLRETVARWVFAPYRRNYRIVPAQLGEDVVVVGAALVAGRRQR